MTNYPYPTGWSTFCATCNRLLIVCTNDPHGCGSTPASKAIVTSTFGSPQTIDLPTPLPPNTVSVPSVFDVSPVQERYGWCKVCDLDERYCRGH